MLLTSGPIHIEYGQQKHQKEYIMMQFL